MDNTRDLRYFCYLLIRKYGSPDKASEEEKANEFRNHYLGDLPPSVKALRDIAISCGIKLDSSDTMPANLRGFNQVINGTNNIIVKDGDTISGTQNTILHEIREIMESIFPILCREYKPLKTVAKHYAANKFATAVLLPEESFTEKVYETGFDVIELANNYSKSCSQVLLRIGEIFQKKLFLYAALYEPLLDHRWLVTYCASGRNLEDSEANVYGLDSLFPGKNRGVSPGSLVDSTIKQGKPYFAEKITLLNGMDDVGLTALANPFLIQGVPSKVVLIVLLTQNKGLLLPQVDRLNPVVVDGFHLHL
jgi:hypothetical protein